MASSNARLLARILLLSSVLILLIFSGASKVQYHGSYYSSDAQLCEVIGVNNAGFEGNVIIMPYDLFGYTILAEGKGHTSNVHHNSELYHKIVADNGDANNEVEVYLKSKNARHTWNSKGTVASGLADLSCSARGTILPEDAGGASDLSHASYLLKAKSHGMVITAESALRASPATTAVATVEWGIGADLGSEESALNQYTNIKSHPGYLTFPTSQQRELITTGMTLEGFYLGEGRPLFSKRFAPIPLDEEHPEGFGFPLTLGVMKVEDDSVYMEDLLKMTLRWNGQ